MNVRVRERETVVDTTDVEPTVSSAVSQRVLRAGLSALALLGFVAYALLFWQSLSTHWFNPRVTSDDSLQQSYMFHSIRHPGIFESDYITDAMESYLAPAHYWLTYVCTYLSGDPIMGGHWVMLLQVVWTLVALFFAVARIAGVVPACFSAAWFLHSRHILQRLTGGLPRGWAAPVLTATICLALYGKHRLVLLVLLFGCLSNPPSTMLAALFYGFVLLWRSWKGSEVVPTALARRRLLQYIALSPIYIAVTYAVVTPPETIGTMATYEEAAANPAFAREGGRFAFIPLLPALEEIRNEGFFAFISLYERIPSERHELIPILVLGLCASIALYALIKRRSLLPAELLLFLGSIALLYFSSRLLAFKLYVPDRHLRLPLGFFFMCALPAALWNIPKPYRRGYSPLLGTLLLALLGALIYYGAGTGLRGHANFNVVEGRKGHLFTWLHQHSEPKDLIAGHPTHIDDTMLFAVRRAYITSETAHPFYDRYYQEVERRLRVVWRAYYARDVREFHDLLTSEGIDFFVFRRNDFRRHELAKATYYQPLSSFVAQLASHPPEEYAFHKLPWGAPHAPNPIMPFRDRYSVVVDLKKLGDYLQAQDGES